MASQTRCILTIVFTPVPAAAEAVALRKAEREAAAGPRGPIDTTTTGIAMVRLSADCIRTVSAHTALLVARNMCVEVALLVCLRHYMSTLQLPLQALVSSPSAMRRPCVALL